MAEQGPKPGSRGKDPSEAEKINNDDLLAILGGVVSPGYAAKKKEEEIIKEEATTPGSAPASTPSPVVPPVAAASAPPSPAPIPGKVAPKIEMDIPASPAKPLPSSSDLEDLQDGVADSEPALPMASAPAAPMPAVPLPPLPPIRPLPPPPESPKPTVSLPASLMPPGMGSTPILPKTPSAPTLPKTPESSPVPGMAPAASGDPLHLFDGPSPAKAPASVPAPPPAPAPPIASTPVTSGPSGDPLHLFDHPAPASAPKPAMDDPLHLFDGASATPPKPGAPQAPPAAADPLHLFDGTASTTPAAPQAPALDPLHLFDAGGFPTSPTPGAGLGGPGMVPPPIAPPKVSANLPIPPMKAKPTKEKKPSVLVKALAPLAAKAKVPVWVLGAAAAALVVGLVALLFFTFQKPAYQLADQVVALRPTRAEVREVVEMDITAFIDIEAKVQQLGFAPLTRLAVPEIPAPNFFSVYMNPQNKTYAIILKLPGVITPKLSFVNTMTTGTWLSTNGWETQSPAMDKLDSESAPNDDPNALWARHQRHLEGATQAGQNPSLTSEWRFVSALCDHLRWYMDMKGIPAYKAAFADWF